MYLLQLLVSDIEQHQSDLAKLEDQSNQLQETIAGDRYNSAAQRYADLHTLAQVGDLTGCVDDEILLKFFLHFWSSVLRSCQLGGLTIKIDTLVRYITL